MTCSGIADALNHEIDFAYGIESAIMGVDDIDRLQAISDRVDRMRGADAERLSADIGIGVCASRRGREIRRRLGVASRRRGAGEAAAN